MNKDIVVKFGSKTAQQQKITRLNFHVKNYRLCRQPFSLVLITSIGYCIFFKAGAAASPHILYEKKASVISNYIQKDITQLHNISV